MLAPHPRITVRARRGVNQAAVGKAGAAATTESGGTDYPYLRMIRGELDQGDDCYENEIEMPRPWGRGLNCVGL